MEVADEDQSRRAAGSVPELQDAVEVVLRELRHLVNDDQLVGG